MKKNLILCGFCIVWIVISFVILKFIFFSKSVPSAIDSDFYPSIQTQKTRTTDGNFNVLASIDDEITENSMWCGTFQLVWNDMVNEVIKKDVIFSPQPQIVENLNKQTFTKKELSPDSYYAKFGLLTLRLKEEIENGIKKKFNENSDILNQLDWSNIPQDDRYYKGETEMRYGFYAMLKKIFKFENAFDELDIGNFADIFNNIRYFGIRGSSSDELYSQVYVYYYNSENDFAVALKTKEGEDVILARGMKGNSFVDLYRDILNYENGYEGKHYFTENDYLKVPELNFRILTEFDELENKSFYMSNGRDSCHIEKALQSIELKLDREGGEIKSEAWIGVMEDSISPMIEEEHRYFYFDKPYVMFLKESDKDLPYFAAQISDITLFQN